MIENNNIVIAGKTTSIKEQRRFTFTQFKAVCIRKHFQKVLRLARYVIIFCRGCVDFCFEGNFNQVVVISRENVFTYIRGALSVIDASEIFALWQTVRAYIGIYNNCIKFNYIRVFRLNTARTSRNGFYEPLHVTRLFSLNDLKRIVLYSTRN